MILIAAGVVALLYVLGVHVGKGFVACLNMGLEEAGLELDRKGVFMLTYLWPVGAAMAMFQDAVGKEEED